MAIKVIRICDICKSEHEQIIAGPNVGYVVEFVCSDCIWKLGRVDDLRILEIQQNDGRGVQCIKDILIFLDDGELDSAKRTYQHDGDKIREYTEIQQWFEKNFGCRLHLEKCCTEALCTQMKQYNDERIARVKKK